MRNLISFNKPYLTGNETNYIVEAVLSGKISGNGMFTEKCQSYFQQKYRFQKCLLTTSCTDALEMAAILCNIQPGDEVIIPSYTFVSTANAFILRGAKIVFADSRVDFPGIDEDKIETLISDKTKVIVPVHYAGIACDMDKIMNIASKHNLLVVEDAAQAIDSTYKGRPLGSIGHFGCFSFHETKNIQCGEGGMLVINDKQFNKRAEIVWEKGTNRAEFFRGEVNKYGWVDIGSSFLPSEITAAFLFAQLEMMTEIQRKRKLIWEYYFEQLKDIEAKGLISLPVLPGYASNNAHMFYLVCRSLEDRTGLIRYLNELGIQSVFHYLSLHKSEFFSARHDGRHLIQADRFTDCLLRLPLYFELSHDDLKSITDVIHFYYSSN